MASDIGLLKYMMGTVIALTMVIVAKVFFYEPGSIILMPADLVLLAFVAMLSIGGGLCSLRQVKKQPTILRS